MLIAIITLYTIDLALIMTVSYFFLISLPQPFTHPLVSVPIGPLPPPIVS